MPLGTPVPPDTLYAGFAAVGFGSQNVLASTLSIWGLLGMGLLLGVAALVLRARQAAVA